MSRKVVIPKAGEGKRGPEGHLGYLVRQANVAVRAAMEKALADIDATRARLIAAGLDVTEVRNGRKPGTRVMTVRTGTCGIQTVLLERSPKPVD